MRIDAHQHYWIYDEAEHVWMTEQHTAIKRPFLPADLEPLLHTAGFDGSIAVQARQNLAETAWLLELADAHPFIRGVVGWVDLCSDEVESQLERFARHPKLRGVRHVLHDEPDDRFMLQPAFQRGIGQLERFGLTYDLLIFPKHLPNACELVASFPNQPFVVDHIAKPLIKDGTLSPWAEDIRRLASYPNVYCKLSGMVTEADWTNWRYEDFKPYLDIVFEAFGPHRLMIGSDWPVSTLCGDYHAVMNVVLRYIEEMPQDVKDAVLGKTCVRFYGLDSERLHNANEAADGQDGGTRR